MDMAGSISFLNGNKMNLSFYEPNVIKLLGIYNIDLISGMPVIDVEWENGISEKLLVISNNYICKVFANMNTPFGKRVFNGISGRQLEGGGDNVWLLPTADKITASSFLVEGNVSYEPNQRRPLYKPLWVEGAEGSGINEKLFITARACFAIHISIGYVSFEKPELYLENSRPKKIKLSVNNIFSIEVELNDTPNYQMINLPAPLRASDVLELEIIEIYQGTKYSDTCINDIFYDYIPWRDIDSAKFYDYIPWQSWIERSYENYEDSNDLINKNNENVILTKSSDNNKNQNGFWVILFILIPILLFIIIFTIKRKR